MKKFTLLLAFIATSSFINAQGLQGVIVEKYYQTNAADATYALNNGASTTLTPGSTVYRVYLDMAPGYKFVQIFGITDNNPVPPVVLHPLVIKTTTDFYNDPNNGQAIGPQSNSLNNTKQGTTLIDSYITTGGVCTGKAGVLKIEDTDGSIGCSTAGVLINNPGGVFGAAINSVVAGAKDGLAPSTTLTAIAPTPLGVGGPGSASDVFDQTAGNTFSCNSCAIAALGGVVGTTTTNAVLIGQFATNGILSFSLNVQITPTANPTAAEVYVPNNAQGTEILFPTLAYNSSSTTVGFDETTVANTSSQFVIYPNPTTDFFTINISNMKENSNNSYAISDISGRLIHSKNFENVSNDFSETIDLSGFKNGLYFVSVSINGVISTKKIIKE